MGRRIQVNHSNNKEVSLYVEDTGTGDPVVLIHGWPLTHRAWDGQIDALVDAGYRVIAYDRRGFGQSDKPANGYDYDTLAADLKGVIEALDLRHVTLAGFSMGGGEVARYIGKYGTENIRSAMLISAVTPYLLRTEDNPNGADASVFEDMINGVAHDRHAFIAQWRRNFMNADNDALQVSQEMLDYLQYLAYPALPKAMKACITAFGTTDFRDDLRRCDIPVLLVHGADDRICPAAICAQAAAPLLRHAQLEILDDAPHGLNITHESALNALMLDFLSS